MKKWGDYYNECRQNFSKDNTNSVYNLSLEILSENYLINLDEQYYKLLENISQKFWKSLNEEGKVEHLNAHSVKSVSPMMEDFRKICQIYFKDYLQENIFGSFVYCDNIKLYHTPLSASEEKSSWQWHLDNSPKEQIKIMIYFTEKIL